MEKTPSRILYFDLSNRIEFAGVSGNDWYIGLPAFALCRSEVRAVRRKIVAEGGTAPAPGGRAELPTTDSEPPPQPGSAVPAASGRSLQRLYSGKPSPGRLRSAASGRPPSAVPPAHLAQHGAAHALFGLHYAAEAAGAAGLASRHPLWTSAEGDWAGPARPAAAARFHLAFAAVLHRECLAAGLPVLPEQLVAGQSGGWLGRRSTVAQPDPGVVGAVAAAAAAAAAAACAAGAVAGSGEVRRFDGWAGWARDLVAALAVWGGPASAGAAAADRAGGNAAAATAGTAAQILAVRRPAETPVAALLK